MDWQLTELPNGLQLVSVLRQETPLGAVRAFFRGGSRYDGSHLGLAHLAEHLLLKGTKNLSRDQIFAQVEQGGGEIQGATTKEYTTFYVVCLKEDLAWAMELLADILINPLLSPKEFLKEKMVVLQEIQRSQDRESTLFDLFSSALWQEHPFRFPILGTARTVEALEHPALVNFFQEKYVGKNGVLAVCGPWEHEEVYKMAADAFGPMPSGVRKLPAQVGEVELEGPTKIHLDKDLNQTHLLVGVPTVAMSHEDRSALKLAEIILGRGLSSRLHKRLREREGLVYSALALAAFFEDTGYLAVKTSCPVLYLDKVLNCIFEEWEELKAEPPTEEEMARAKGNYRGSLARHFETNLAVASIFGIEALLSKVEPFEMALARIEAVSRKEIEAVSAKYLNQQKYALATLGLAQERPQD